MRNKVIGHKDAMPAEGHSSTPNILRLRRDSTGFDIHTLITMEMDLALRQRVQDLCSHFVAYCDREFDEIVRRYPAEFSAIPPGDYDILLSEPPDDWIRAAP